MSKSLHKTALVDNIAAKTGITKSAIRAVLSAQDAVITEALANGYTARIAALGTFKPTTRKARTARNPKTGEAVALPETRTVKFVVSKTLKDAVKTNND